MNKNQNSRKDRKYNNNNMKKAGRVQESTPRKTCQVMSHNLYKSQSDKKASPIKSQSDRGNNLRKLCLSVNNLNELAVS